MSGYWKCDPQLPRDGRLFYEVVGSTTRKFGVDHQLALSNYGIICELADKQTRKKISIAELFKIFRNPLESKEVFLYPTTSQTTDQNPTIVRLDEFFVICKRMGGELSVNPIKFILPPYIDIVCDKGVASSEGWLRSSSLW